VELYGCFEKMKKVPDCGKYPNLYEWWEVMGTLGAYADKSLVTKKG
jgi:hypothetical protein